ncbi:MAG TPA: NUDIX domain-containing protein [Actinomycetota bacterium]
MAEDIRKAAAAIVAREGRDGVEVLSLERSARSRFLPGYVAFPGGAADVEDARLAARWFGTADEATRACAVRELLEEVGLALTAEGLREADDRTLAALEASPPRAEQLVEVAHWVAPPDVPVRFDARYFAIVSPDGLRPRPDGVEVADAWWVSPRRLLEEWEREERKLYWPTYFTVRALAACETVGDLLAVRIHTREPNEGDVERLPRATFWQE